MLPFMVFAISENATGTDIQTQLQESWSLSTMAFHIFFPLAGLVFLWNRKTIMNKILMQFDRNCVSVFCPSFSQREKLLKWAGNRLPSTWSSPAKTLSGGVAELFFDGSLLCTLINSAVPGACPNPHRHWKKPPIHAQAIAYKYLGIVPVFTERDLSGDFSTTLERHFLEYLHSLQEAIDKLQENKTYANGINCDYIARGMGLYTGEQNRKIEFYIYPNPNVQKRTKSTNECSVIIQIRGPFGTFGKAEIPRFYGKLFPQKKRTDFLNKFSLKKMIKYHNKTYGDNLIIDVKLENERAKVSYVPKNDGIYEINLIENGQLLKGCPFNVNVLPNTSGIIERLDEDQKEQPVIQKKRKIISKTIDFIDTQIPMEVLKKNNKEDSSFKEVVDEVTKNALIVNEQEKLQIKNAHEELVTTAKNVEKNQKKLMREEKILEESEDEEEIVPNVTKKEVDGFAFDKNNETIENENQDPSEDLSDSLECNQECQHSNIHTPDNVDANTTHDYTNKTVSFPNIADNPNNATTHTHIVNKITIPDVFSQKPKSVLFTSERVEKLTDEMVEDLNNNAIETTITLVPPRFFESKDVERESTKGVPGGPSPICEHIVPEGGEFRKMSLVEKRKAFCKQLPLAPEATSQDSSFSSENAEVLSLDKWENKSDKMSILDVLDSLKHIDNDSSFTSTISLPNFPYQPEGFSSKKVRERKDFWEKISSRSSSSLSHTQSEMAASPKRDFQQNPTDYEKMIWSKPEGDSKRSFLKKRTSNLTKSADDILSLSDCLGYSSKKYRSMDNSLDICAMMSIDERKKLLLKQDYDKEKCVQTKLTKSKSSTFLNKESIIEEKNNTNNNNTLKIHTVSPKVLEKIRQFDSTANTTDTKDKKELKTPETKPINVIMSDLKKAVDPESIKVKSHFKKAINYFKNLENKSKTSKSKSRENFEDARRRFSLEFPKIKRKNERRYGSLNLAKVSQRFKINNLYNDVFGTRRGSFRGTPNKRAVAEALKSLAKSEHVGANNDEEFDENIKYNFFKNSKRKQRKSIRSIFDVNY